MSDNPIPHSTAKNDPTGAINAVEVASNVDLFRQRTPDLPPIGKVTVNENDSTLQSNPSSVSIPRSHTPAMGSASGTWTSAEDDALRRGCVMYGVGHWKAIAENLIPSRTSNQVKSHAQKMKKYRPWEWAVILESSRQALEEKRRKQILEHQLVQTNEQAKAVSVMTNVRTRQTKRKFKERKYPSISSNGWTEEEHLAFCNGCLLHGISNWKKIADTIPTRTSIQVKSHAQKVKLHRPLEWTRFEVGFAASMKKENEDREKGVVTQKRVVEPTDNNCGREKKSKLDTLETVRNLLLLSKSKIIDLPNPHEIDSTKVTESVTKKFGNDAILSTENICSIRQSGCNSSCEMSGCTKPSSSKDGPRHRLIMGYDATVAFGTGNDGAARSDRPSSLGSKDGPVDPTDSSHSNDSSVSAGSKTRLSSKMQIAPPCMASSASDIRGTEMLTEDIIHLKGLGSNSLDLTKSSVNLSNASVEALRTILSRLNSTEILKILPSMAQEMNSLRAENDSLKATVERLQLKLSMERRKNDLIGRNFSKMSGVRDVMDRAGLSALKVRSGNNVMDV